MTESVRLLPRLLRHGGFRIGFVLAVLLILLALFGPFLAHNPNAAHYTHQLSKPSGAHWLGTDNDGRDDLARTLAGARATLGAALLVFCCSTTIGIVLGTVAGFVGGTLDLIISRVTDVVLGVPELVLALAIIGALGPGFSHLILAMIISGWAGLAKLARNYTLGSHRRPDVIAAQMAGVSRARIIVGHVLPRVCSQTLIAATLGLGGTILGIAGLSFLGLGIQPPTAEWGSMLNDSRLYDTVDPWLLLGPGLGIALSVLAATLISDALRDCTDPSRA